MDYRKEYTRWCALAKGLDADVEQELAAIRGEEEKIQDAFYRDLAFGTGGLRGVIGAGTNRMNVYTVAKASQGLANYVRKHFAAADRRIAVSRDSRIKSDLFAETAARVFAANGIDVYMYEDIMPTPCLSFATRALHCAAGIMLTASHNPSKYNGYKVYGADGCQITTEAAAEILAEIEALDLFIDIRMTEFEIAGTRDTAEANVSVAHSVTTPVMLETATADATSTEKEAASSHSATAAVDMDAPATGHIFWIGEAVYTDFVENVKKQSVLGPDDSIDRNVAIVYSPLNGTGRAPVTRTLRECGYTNITLVKEQEMPDGHFPTCPYPNPEIKEAMALGMDYAERVQADLLLATDPDCDRVGIAVRRADGSYQLLSGNETGILLLDYILAQRTKHGTLPKDPVMVKTIVTMDLGERIAAHYGVETINVLTGFKFIGEQIGRLEKEGHPERYVFGFEESYGYLTGSYVRDKDAVDGALMICEMFCFYKTQGISLLDRLQALYAEYGYCLNTLHSFTFEGSAGFEKMQKIMQNFRTDAPDAFDGKKVEKVLDYLPGLDGLPKSDVLKYLLNDHCSVVVRPSGTEPKLKIYISISAENQAAAEACEAAIAAELGERMK